MNFLNLLFVITFAFCHNLQGTAAIECTCVERFELPGRGGDWVNNRYQLSVPNCPACMGIIKLRNMENRGSTNEIRINENGVVTQRSGDPYSHVVNGGFGEKFNITIVAADNETILAETTLIPFPFILTYEGGQTIEIKASDTQGLFVMLEGSGFKPNEVLKYKSWSSGEVLNSKIQIGKNGDFGMLYSAAVIGKKEGPYEITFIDEAQKTYKVRHIWGRIAYENPLVYEQIIQKYQFPTEPY